MKTLVVYYSRTGTTQSLAIDLATRLGADVEKLVDTVDRSGIAGFLRAGRDALKKKETKLAQLRYRPEDYELVLLLTPMWAGSMPPATRTYVHEQQGRFKELALAVTRGGADPARLFQELEQLAGQRSLARLALLTREVRQGRAERAVQEFAELIK